MASSIFVSYKHHEKEFVDDLCASLTKTGMYRVWYDTQIRGGDAILPEVARHIRQSDCFLAVISRGYAGSEYCRKELQIADELHKPIIPVNLDLTDDEYRSLFETIVYRKRVEVEGHELSAAALADILGALSKALNRVQSSRSDAASVEQKGIAAYPNRLAALADFTKAIESEETEIMVIGSSLKGLIQDSKYRDVFQLLLQKMKDHVHVYFLLTHPGYGDVRAEQENRRPGAIGQEIIESLRALVAEGVPPRWIRLYRGTPTTFAIKTTFKMLLNPYPYRVEAFNSPCLIVDRQQAEEASAFYDQFGANHFSVWDTSSAVILGRTPEDFNASVYRLEEYLRDFTEAFEYLREKIHEAAQAE